MQIEKVDKCDKYRIPLAQGEVDGRKFAMSIFTDGTGCILEFDGGKKYLLKTEEIVAEILKEEKNERV